MPLLQHPRPTLFRLALFSVNAIFLSVLAGCGMGTQTASMPTSTPGVSLTGRVHGGQQPVTGSAVYFFAAGNTGYDSAAKSLLTPGDPGVLTDGNGQGYVLTDNGGNFSITSDYTCPSSTRNVYLVAVGGNPGLSTPNTNNADLVLVAALGPCGNLESSTSIFINEVSTIAAAYSLNGFVSPNTSTTLSTGGTSTTTTIPSIAATITNSTGITNAFNTVQNLINPTTGTAYGTITGTSIERQVPQAEINSLADILSYCVNTNGTDGSCDTLFAYATPSGGATPSNTFAAAIDIAQNPGHNVSSLFGLTPSTPPFTGLTQAPNQWSLFMAYATVNSAYDGDTYGVAIDAQGNAWFTAAGGNGQDSGYIFEITAAGQLANVYGTFDAPEFISIDSTGSVWAAVSGNNSSDNGGIFTLNPSTSITSFYTSSSLVTPADVVPDGSGNLWIAIDHDFGTDGSVIEINSSGQNVGTSPYTVGGINIPRGIAIGSSGIIWVTNDGGYSVTQLNGGAAVNGDPFTGSGNIGVPFGIAIDASGNAWVSNVNNNTITKLTSSGSYIVNYSGGGLDGPAHLSIDGSGNVFVPNFDGSSLTKLKSDGTPASGSPYVTGSTLTPATAAVDGSGNVWMSTGNFNGIIEYIGLGVPVVTPLVTGVQNGTLGTRP